MRVILTVIAGPHKGREFAFDKHDTFLVGRSKNAHFQLSAKDRYFSRIHFMIEVNPPQCRVIDMGSQNGTYVNGAKVLAADLKADDQIRAGHTILRVKVVLDDKAQIRTFQEREVGSSLPVVPGYTLLRELGRGPMGAAYLGQHSGETTLRTVKVVQPSVTGSAEQIDAFLQAARKLTQLDHPNIVRLREVGFCASGFYFAADQVSGLNAAAVIERDGPLSIARALRLAEQLLKALEYAHAKQFIHRNIKPANLLITQADGQETIHLADFGIARVYHAAPFGGLSVTAEMLDAAAYLPPEVLFNYHDVNPRADQYSAAAALYYLLTDQPTLEMPAGNHRRFSTVLRRQCVPLAERRTDVPTVVTAAIQKALSRTPAHRFANIAEFRHALIP